MGGRRNYHGTERSGSRELLYRQAGRLARMEHGYGMVLGLIIGAAAWLTLFQLAVLTPFVSIWPNLAIFVLGLAGCCYGGYHLARRLIARYASRHYREAWGRLIETNLALTVMDETLLHYALDPLYDSTARKWLVPPWPRTIVDQVRTVVAFREALSSTSRGKPPGADHLSTGLYRSRGCDFQLSFALASVFIVGVLVLLAFPLWALNFLNLTVLMILLYSVLLHLINGSWEAALCHWLLDEPELWRLFGWQRAWDHRLARLPRD